MGGVRAEASSAIGDGGQAAISLMPDIDGIGLVSCWITFYLPSLKKKSSDVWVVALFSLS